MSAIPVVFVDGIGGRRWLRGAVFRELGALGHRVEYFGYRASRDSLDDLRKGLSALLREVSADGSYAIVGYSFGGVLARDVLLRGDACIVPPVHLFQLASPMRATRLCAPFADTAIYRRLTGECGQVVARAERMAAIGQPDVPTTCLYGTRGVGGPLTWLVRGHFAHDGMIAVDEAAPERFADAVEIRASHPFIATRRDALRAIAERLPAVGTAPAEARA